MHIRYKEIGSDQALELRNIQPGGDASDHPFHGIAADRKISQPSLSFMSDSSGVRVLLSPQSPGTPPPLFFFPNGYLPGLLRSPPSLILFYINVGDKRGRGKRDAENKKT